MILKTPGCIKKIPLNPPLQKGEAVGMPGLIEMLHDKQLFNYRFLPHFDFAMFTIKLNESIDFLNGYQAII
jgi:hypothetical protein